MSIYGLRQVGTGRCPRRLVGRGHRAAGCWCGTRLNDHGATWADQEGRKAVVWQPYDADGVELAEVIRHAEADGLDVAVTGASAHYPGGTFAIFFCAGGSDSRRRGSPVAAAAPSRAVLSLHLDDDALRGTS